jgi:hypothetical protein
VFDRRRKLARTFSARRSPEKTKSKGVRRFLDRFPGGRFENLKVVVAGNFGTLQWDFVASDASGKSVTAAGCDLLEFRDGMVTKKNAFRKVKG